MTARQPRLVVVSNRVTPVTSRKVMAGGLAAGVLAALRESGGIWFGWSGAISDQASPEPNLVTHDKITYLTCDLNQRDFEEYYNGFSNRTLWPLLHYRLDLTVFDRRTATLWTGDLLFRERVPVVDGSLKGWLDVLAKLRSRYQP